MGRRKDVNWDLPERVETWEQVQVAVLMDIRDELKQLNRTLGCHNFLSIPHTLKGIRRKIPTPKPRMSRGRSKLT